MITVGVLGSTGMLGHTVCEVLEADPRFEVRRYCRDPREGEHFVDACIPGATKSLDEVEYVINCVGLIKQLVGTDRRDWFVVNSIFPWLLAERCVRNDAKLIQISTDCVYDGKRGSYSEEDAHDATDDYGLSKSLGEPAARAMVLRTSVIGHENRGKLSLLEWAISQRGKHVQGYANHFWNGLTAIEYANICKRIMLQRLYERGTYHVFSDTVSKHLLLTMINDAYKLDLEIMPTITPERCDRTLATVEGLNSALEIPSLAEMIRTMARSKR